MASALSLLRVPLARTGMMMMGAQTTLVVRRKAVPLIRNYASGAGAQSKGSGSKVGIFAIIAAAGAGGGYYWWTTQESASCKSKTKQLCNYQQVYNAIAKLLEDEGYDDGSYGPVFLRLAWHAAGTYDKDKNDGGSCKGTMRFEPESTSEANNGLHIPRQKLDKIKERFPWISYGDLWTLAGVVAVQEMGGPKVAWKPGRVDGTAADCPPDGRLPDGGNSCPQHARDIFYRMGFNDQQIVALVGAHGVGRCHPDRSGFDGPWTNSPTMFSNFYFIELMSRTWVDKKWTGPKQFVDKESERLMMLPADMGFLKDPQFRQWVEIYAKDENKFFEDFAKAYQMLLELGVEFPEGTKDMIFKTTS